MSEESDLLGQLKAANSDADVLDAFANASGRKLPSLAQLKEWYDKKCLPSVKSEFEARLRALQPYGTSRQYNLFPEQGDLALLDSNTGDASPLTITTVFLRAWDNDRTLRHPWAILVKNWQEHCPPALANLIVTREPNPPRDKRALELSRAAAVLHLASLAVVEMEGEPFVSDAPLWPGLEAQRFRVMPTIEQPDLGRDLKPYPKTIQGQATAGILVEALANLDLTGDERSPLRADILRLGEIAYALTRTVHFSAADGAVLLGGRDTPALRQRLNGALWGLRGLRVQIRDGVFYALADAEPGPVNALGPPRWWAEEMRERERQSRGRRGRRERLPPSERPLAYRLSGGLFRPLSFGRKGGGLRGTAVGASGRLGQTVAGIEAAVTWGPTPGRGKGAMLPRYVTPIKKGGHGEPILFPAWRVLRVSGENVTTDTMDNTAYARFGRRARSLEAAGYFLGGHDAAPAGDTIEIVERKLGSRSQSAGLVVRATARFCEAYVKGKRVRIPAHRLLNP